MLPNRQSLPLPSLVACLRSSSLAASLRHAAALGRRRNSSSYGIWG
jgi:hypothetical protein